MALSFIPLITGLTLGLASSLHCVAMCGGIVSSLSLGIRSHHPAKPTIAGWLVTSYNLGRISSYVLAGLILGGVTGSSVATLNSPRAFQYLQLVAAITLLITALRMGGWLPRPHWQGTIRSKTQPLLAWLGSRLLPVRTPGAALLYGSIWGWLPCAMVYSTLVLAATTGNAAGGGLFMLAFGLGTLPSMITAGLFARFVKNLAATRQRFNQFTSVLIFALAIATLAGALKAPTDHSTHLNQPGTPAAHHH